MVMLEAVSQKLENGLLENDLLREHYSITQIKCFLILVSQRIFGLLTNNKTFKP